MSLEHLILQFSRSEELHWENVLSGKHLSRSSTQTDCNIGFKLFQQTAVKRRACICHNIESFIFCCNSSTNFKVYFGWKPSKKQIIQQIPEKKKIAGTLLFATWFAAFQWEKIIENYNSDGVGVRKEQKKVFGPTLVLLWPRFSQYSNSTNR